MMTEKLRALIYLQELETIIYKMNNRIDLVPSEKVIVNMILTGNPPKKTRYS